MGTDGRRPPQQVAQHSLFAFVQAPQRVLLTSA
jgi:hypothetical protein